MRTNGWYVIAVLVVVALVAFQWHRFDRNRYAGGAVEYEAQAVSKARAVCGEAKAATDDWHARVLSGVWVAYAVSRQSRNGHPRSGMWVRIDAGSGEAGRCVRWTQ
jgi:hypothetical protein